MRTAFPPILCALLLCLPPISAPAEEGNAKLKVLVITGGHGFEEPSFFEVFKADPAISFTHAAQALTNATAWERPDLLSYDAVVLYDMAKNITETQKTRFLALLAKGVGLIVLHHALLSFQQWPEYEHIIGGRYPVVAGKTSAVTPQAGYQHDVEVPVIIAAPGHPVTAGVQNFTIHDEIFWGFRVGNDVTPLLTTKLPKSGKPLAWCRTQGQSRIVYLQPGHDHFAFENSNFRRLVSQSIRWTARR